MNFLETPRFNTEIRYGAVGGPEFNNSVITVTSGAEGRTSNWAESRGQWAVGNDLYTRSETDDLISFFRSRRGKAGGFRFKDWSDFKTTASDGVLTTIVGSTTTLQLAKLYASGSNTSVRKITKPVPGTVQIYLADVLMPIQPAINYTTGVVTLPAGDYTWIGQFDVPVRFDSDQLITSFEGYRDTDGESLFSIIGLPLVEIAVFTL